MPEPLPAPEEDSAEVAPAEATGSGNETSARGSSEALRALIGLLRETVAVEDLLDDLARLGATVLEPPAVCAVTMRHDSDAFTVAASAPLARHVDELQYDARVGPCLEALSTGRVVYVQDLADEPRWGGYPAHAVAYGVRSSLSLPLSVDGVTVAALNLYSGQVAAFGPTQTARALEFASQATTALTVVTRQAASAVLADQLREALSSRSLIDHAIGIVMAQQRCDAAKAFEVLRQASQHRNRKLRDIAADVVTAVSGHRPQSDVPA